MLDSGKFRTELRVYVEQNNITYIENYVLFLFLLVVAHCAEIAPNTDYTGLCGRILVLWRKARNGGNKKTEREKFMIYNQRIFCERLAKKYKITYRDAEEMYIKIFRTLSEILQEENDVKIKYVGVLYHRDTVERMGVNPNTLKPQLFKSKPRVHFFTSRWLIKKLEEGRGAVMNEGSEDNEK